MHNQYETVIIGNPVLSDADWKQMINQFVKLVKDNGATIIEENSWGMRKLAYPIQKKNSGFYYLIEYTDNGAAVNKLETELKRNENILRFLTVSLDKYAIEYNAKKRRGEAGPNRKNKIKNQTQEA